MDINHAYATTQLTGDWTIGGVVKQVTRLTELQICGTRPNDTFVIDCSGIEDIDLNGFQLLFVWLHCIQLSGHRPKLVNLPGRMHDAQERLGIAQVFEKELKERGFE